MISNIFSKVFSMSITASIVAVIIIIIRLLFSKGVPKIFSYVLWSLVLIRLIIPISFSSIFSVFNVIDIPKNNIQVIYQKNSKETKENVLKENNISSSTLKNINDETKNMKDLKKLNKLVSKGKSNEILTHKGILIKSLPIIWIVGAILLFLSSLIIYVKTSNNLKEAVLYKDDEIIEKYRKKYCLIKKLKYLYLIG